MEINEPNMSDPAETSSDLSLYQSEWCPFCVRVRGAIEQLGVDLELRDVEVDASHLQDLVAATGRQTVPCLRIETPANADGASGDVRWMHESSDIIAYLQQRFS